MIIVMMTGRKAGLYKQSPSSISTINRIHFPKTIEQEIIKGKKKTNENLS
ncbi:hypothetical protein VBD025_05915 [Virgibacillus flavescens]